MCLEGCADTRRNQVSCRYELVCATGSSPAVAGFIVEYVVGLKEVTEKQNAASCPSLCK